MILETIGLPLIALLPFVGAILVFLTAKTHRLTPVWIAGGITLLTILILSYLSYIPFNGDVLVQSWSWIEAIGFNFSFRIDGLGMLFAYIVLGIGILIIFYARYYLSKKDSTARFNSYMLLFMGSMLGIVLSENILLLILFWELTSLSSFLLISFWQYKKDGRDGGMMALVITGAGGLFLFASMLILGSIVGSYELSVVLESRDIILSSPYFTAIFLLFFMGVITKSAQFPFHFWLPHAMAAPTPVSAYLHSATMVKAGIFLLARFYPVYSGTDEWIMLVSTTGLLTLLIGAFIAFFKQDLKGLMAYSTVSHLGLITFLLGLSTPLAVVAAIFHTINHAAFKAASFMIVGIIDHQTGTRDINKLGGLLGFMPYTATLAMVVAASMAGFPPLNGFLSKEMLFERAIIDGFIFVIPVLVTIAGVFSVAYSLRFIADVFFGKANNMPVVNPREPHYLMKLPIALLAFACVSIGIAPMILISDMLFTVAGSTLATTPPKVHIALWHGFNLPLLMSLIAVGMGVLLYLKRKSADNMYDKYLVHIDARDMYNWTINYIFKTAKLVHLYLHQGKIYNSIYTLIVLSLLAGLVGFRYTDAPLFGTRAFLPIDLVSLTITIFTILSIGAVVRYHRNRFVTLVIIGIAGLIMALIFIKFSAPDLALTQLSVEVVTIVLMLLTLYYLPAFSPKESLKKKIGVDAILSVFGGIGVFILTLSVLSREFTTISDFFIANAKTGGGGTNVVNVILVDFRGLDTLGEIIVLGIAGLGIFAMLQGLKLYTPIRDADGIEYSHDTYPLIMKTLISVFFPVMLMAAFYIFLRGHNLPGGGFIAGLIAAVALIVQYLASGIAWSSERIGFNKHALIAIGVIIATATGLGSMILGYPFLTSAFTYLDLPIVGKFEIASALLFDLGVFLVVVGSTAIILVNLGRLSTISHYSSIDIKQNEEN